MNFRQGADPYIILIWGLTPEILEVPWLDDKETTARRLPKYF
jgi:hypothetical protein